MKKLLLLVSVLSTLSCSVDAQKKEKPSKIDKELIAQQPDGIYARIETNRGDIYAMLDYKQAPMTVANFVGLAEGKIKNDKKAPGVPYFDGLIFHRIIPGFMIQGACPLGTGTGDPGYKFPDELDAASEIGKRGYVRGALAMANSGPNTNGSQFFIMQGNTPLPLSYNLFGMVIKGIEVVDSIVATPRESNDRPKVEQTMRHVTIIRKGKEAEAFDAVKVFEDEKINGPAKMAARAKAANEARAIADAALLKQYETAKVTATGLKYIVEKEGTGKAPTGPASNVTVHYVGTFLNGDKIDSSIDRGEPATFGLNQVIPGWTEGVQMMKEGGKVKLIIPPNLAWGEAGRPGIPPNSWVVFTIELIKVVN
jgi:peptidyl-prolyl cis-trans isomerase A (cyclophilin A)